MAKVPKITFLPGLHFNGPKELAPAWDHLTRTVSDDGKSGYDITSANLLNDLVFGRGAINLLAQYDIKPNAQLSKDWLETHPEDKPKANALHTLKERIERVALISSELSRSKGSIDRKLNAIISEELIHQWVDLEKASGLYPPPPISSGNGTSSNKRQDALERRDALLRTAKGGLLAGALRMVLKSVIGGQVARAYKKHCKLAPFKPLSLEEVEEMADKQFELSLFSYELNSGSSFRSWAYGNLAENLDSRILRKWEQKRHDPVKLSLDRPLFKDSKRTLLDSLTKTMSVTADAHDNGEKTSSLYAALNQLDPRDRTIVELRNGIPDGNALTLEEIGQKLGISKERVRQIENRAMRELHMLLVRTSYANGNGTFVNRLEQKRQKIPMAVREQREKLHSFFTDAKGYLLTTREVSQAISLDTNMCNAILEADCVSSPKKMLSELVKEKLCDLLSALGKGPTIAEFKTEFETLRKMVGYKGKAASNQDRVAER